MLRSSHRSAVIAAIVVGGLMTVWFNLDRTSLSSKIALHTSSSTTGHRHLPAPVSRYFDQVFSPGGPATYDFPALRQHCEHTAWSPELENVYLQCGGMYAGMTSIMSEVKVCLKMALEAGTGIVLPTMPLRDSTDLKEFNKENNDAYMAYDKWFDADHLIKGLGRACPQMKILHPDQLNQDKPDKVAVKNQWEIDIMNAPYYRQYVSHFWAGRPFKTFFDQEFAKLREQASPDPGNGISVIKINAIFLLFRITDDPTGLDLKLWNDLSLLMRFLEKPRKVVDQLLGQIHRPFYGVHFRVENDTIWSPLEDQLRQALDGLDKAWSLYGNEKSKALPGTVAKSSEEKPLVYLACGDEAQMQKFVEAGAARGWDVTHKWEMARQSTTPTDTENPLLHAIDELPFDFQGAVDLGIMIQSDFFLGISGSAFSNTIAHVRDVTGRYRGSSLREWVDDEGARSHLFMDSVASSYPCCL